jgi:hypothetical protein
MIFENDDAQSRFSIGGSAFLVIHENRVFAVTAKHVFSGYSPSQYRIPNCLGSHNMLPIRQPFTADLYCGENYEAVDFEDFVVAQINSAEITGGDFDPADACIMDESAIQWSAIQKVGVYGFPSDIQSVDYEQALMSIQPYGMIGHLTGQSFSEGLREIQFGAGGDLNSYAGFSGAPVFQVGELGTIGRLLGIVLSGSRDTSASRKCHFLDIRVVAPLIRQHLQLWLRRQEGLL